MILQRHQPDDDVLATGENAEMRELAREMRDADTETMRAGPIAKDA